MHRPNGGMNSRALRTPGDFRTSPFISRCIRAQWLRKPNASNALDSQLRNLVTSLALELEPQGVRVGTVTVCGFIEPGTPSARSASPKEFFAGFSERATVPRVTRRRCARCATALVKPPHRDQGPRSAVIAGDDEHSAAALPLRPQDGFGDRVRSSQSYGTGA